MKIEVMDPGRLIEITLSRRNLLTLLAKIASYPPKSACTIKRDCRELGFLVVKGESDEVHYALRVAPGRMHPDTESAVRALGATPYTRRESATGSQDERRS